MIEYVHMFMYMSHWAAESVAIAESCEQGQLWQRSEVTQFSASTEVGMDGGGQATVA